MSKKEKPPTPPLWCVKTPETTHWLLADRVDRGNNGSIALNVCEQPWRQVAVFAPGHWESVIRCDSRGYPNDVDNPLEPGLEVPCGTSSDADPMVEAFGEAFKAGICMGIADTHDAQENEAPQTEAMAEADAGIGESLDPPPEPGVVIGPALESMGYVPDPSPRHSDEKLDKVAEFVRSGSGSLKDMAPEEQGRVVEAFHKGWGDEPPRDFTKEPPYDGASLEDCAVKPPEPPSKASYREGVVAHHLKEGKALCARLGVPVWRVITSGRLEMINRRMKAEEITGYEFFWTRANEVLGNINVEDWMRDLDLLLKVPQRGTKDHFLKASEGGYREIAKQEEGEAEEVAPF